MAYPERRTFGPRQEEKDSEDGPVKFRFEIGGGRFIVYGFGLVALLVWMFVCGVLVGREHSLVEVKDFSFRAHFLRFLGFGHQPAPVPADAAATWVGSDEMMKSLGYHESLSQGSPASVASSTREAAAAEVKNPPQAQGVKSPVAAATAAGMDVKSPSGPASASTPASSQTQARKPTPAATTTPAATMTMAANMDVKSPSGPASASTPASPQTQGARKPTPAATMTTAAGTDVKSSSAPEVTGERYTLLVSSFNTKDKAQKLVDQFKAKGYPVRLQVVEGRVWRVLVGKFENHDKAAKFNTEFNQREHTTALVVREAL